MGQVYRFNEGIDERMKCEHRPELTCYYKRACQNCNIMIDSDEEYTPKEWEYYNKNLKFISNPFNWNKKFTKR